MAYSNSFILPWKVSTAICISLIFGALLASQKCESKSIVFPEYSDEEYSDTFLDTDYSNRFTRLDDAVSYIILIMHP